MNFQELLDYRKICLIHDLPMESLVYTADLPKGGRTKMSIKTLPAGVFLHLRGQAPDQGAVFLHDGTYLIDDSQKALRKILDNTVHILRRCSECAKSKNIPVEIETTATTISMVRESIHFYNFYLFPVIDTEVSQTYMMGPGRENIRYLRNDKFYHMSARIGGGEATFRLGRCAGTDLLEQLLDSLMNLKVPQFDPIRIQSVDALVEKIKIYNLFS